MLLIFAAGLPRQFRFVSIVTILQQTIHGLSLDHAGIGRSLSRCCKKAKGIASKSPAKELGKRWRFFPTYAEV
jgi:hypothetical protein